MLKHCKKCDTTKPIENFYLAKGRKDGRSWWCSDCARAHRKKKYDPAKNREYQLKSLYNVSTEVYDLMYSQQGGACKICRKNFDSLCVDHDHKTGNVRGLLCHKCNKAIGLLEDDISNLSNAITYLNEHAGTERSPVTADCSTT